MLHPSKVLTAPGEPRRRLRRRKRLSKLRVLLLRRLDLNFGLLLVEPKLLYKLAAFKTQLM